VFDVGERGVFKYLRCFEEEGRGTARTGTQASQQWSVLRPNLMGASRKSPPSPDLHWPALFSK